MSPSTEGIKVVMVKAEEPLSDAPSGKDQPQLVELLEVVSPVAEQTCCMYWVMSTQELHTARVEKSGQVQFPVGQVKETDGFGSARNMPLKTAAFMGRMGTKLLGFVLSPGKTIS